MEMYRLINIERMGKTIMLVTRNTKLKRVIFEINDFYPFCYIKHGVNVPILMRNSVHKREIGGWKTLFNVSMDKIYMNTPESVAKLRDKLNINDTGEADVIYTTRFLIELKMNTGYFVVEGKHITNQSGYVEASHKDIVPIEPPFTIPIREFEIDVESVKNELVLIGLWDSYTNTHHSLMWKDGENSTYNDTFTGMIKTGKVTTWEQPFERTVRVLPNKAYMLVTFLQMVQRYKPDVVGAWWLPYDMPMIYNSIYQCGLDVRQLSPFRSAPVPEKIKGLVLIDQLYGVKKILSKELRSFKLGQVFKELYNVVVPSHPKTIPDMYENGGLINYNSGHVDACRMLSVEQDVIEFIYQLVYSCCSRFDDVESPLRLIDSLLLSVKDANIIYPNKQGWDDTTEDKVKGATVIEPVPGLKTKYDIILDASKLYPTIMYWMNLGVENLDPNGDIVIDIYDDYGEYVETIRFNSSKPSELRKAFDVLFALRDKYDVEIKQLTKKDVKGNSEIIKLMKKKSFSTKINTNTIYGGTGNKGFRLYDKNVQKCTTQIARDVIQHSQRRCRVMSIKLRMLFEILYGDTDSIHVHCEVDTLVEAIEIGYKLEADINKSFDNFVKTYGIKEHKFSFKMEAIAETALYKAKKRYAMNIVWEDGVTLPDIKQKIVGLETERSDSPEITSKVMKRVLKMILSETDNNKILRYINKHAKRITDGKLTPYEIGLPKSIKKTPKEYFTGKCRQRKTKAGMVGCGAEFEGFAPFSEMKEHNNRIVLCPTCGRKITWLKPIHAVAVDYSNTYLGTEFNEYTKIRYVYVDVINKQKYHDTHVIAIDEDTEIPKDFKINYELHAQKIILDKVLPLVELVSEPKSKPLTCSQETLEFDYQNHKSSSNSHTNECSICKNTTNLRMVKMPYGEVLLCKKCRKEYKQLME